MPCWIVMRSWFDPSMFIVYSSVFDKAGSLSVTNTIFELFGAYAGHRSGVVLLVSRNCSSPPGRMV
jgi:hypothetical protein